MRSRFPTAVALFAAAISPSQAVSPVAAGPWCGAVTHQSIAATAHLTGPGLQARLAVSTVPDFSNPLFSAPVTSAAVTGNNVRVDLSGLTADTQYYYALEVGGVLETAADKTGTFRTFPLPGPTSFRFCFASCGDWHENGQYVHQKILTENPRFFIHMGDFNYEDTDEDNEQPYRENIINSITLSPEMGEMVRKLPTAYIWDDHDFSGNTSDKTSNGRRASRAVYRELVPHYPLPAGGPNEAIYQAFTCGRVRFLLSDLRSDRNRDSDTDNANKSMMGPVQKQWFKDQLVAARDAEVPLIVWMSGVPFIQVGSVRDNWGSYSVERKELLEFIRDQDIRNVVIISGDMHALAYDDGRATDSYVAGVRIPVFHAAALTRDGSEKGGPYSGGVSEGPQRYGIMDIADDGTNVSATYTGRIATSASNATTWKTYRHNAGPVKPRPPLGLTASPSLNAIHLHWSDNSTVETGYRVERRIGAGTWALLGTTGAAVLDFNDTTAATGTTYEYRAITLNGSEQSTPSATASAAASNGYHDWKVLHFGSADVADDANDDLDGMNTMEEYLFDKNPLQQDRYAWDVVTNGSGADVNFATSTGRSYRVEASDDLKTWPITSPQITGDGSVKQWQDTGFAPGGCRYYRVIVTESP
ncbi:alkaline phosphatase D family protein [Haloferula sp. BvORR071]|uniref:alkaline phosphatase D family protein n=1 Tax=Haloferula sp. BvORR071 TaxID=1396141 RepID=UPI002240F4D2|nr:alkaline phosphatase D family protein [Haloferula sp. BvORR071]